MLGDRKKRSAAKALLAVRHGGVESVKHRWDGRVQRGGRRRHEGVGQAASERQAAAEAYSIVCDKTRWMRCLWEDGHAVTVVSRPPGFGKTHFLTRLRAFFEMDYARPIEPPATA